METKLFPLYEIIDGKEYRITHQSKGLPVRVREDAGNGTVTSPTRMWTVSSGKSTRTGTSWWPRQKEFARNRLRLRLRTGRGKDRSKG